MDNEYNYEPTPASSHRAKNIALIVIPLVIIIAAGGLTIYHFAHKKSPVVSSCKGTSCSQTTKNPQVSSSVNGKNSPIPGPAPASGPSVPTTSGNQPSSPDTTLTNTGPGSEIGIFMGSTVAGSLIYHLYQRKKMARQ